MKTKTKTVLLILVLIGFITMAVLLVTKIGDIGKLGASVTYDTNGCPKDGRKWTYNKSNNTCTANVGYTYTCADGYKYSSTIGKCYKAATRRSSDYYCPSGSTYTKNIPNVGKNLCLRKKDKAVCAGNSVKSNGSCYVTQKAVATKYTVTYNANGGTASKNGKSYSAWSEKATYGSNYKTYDNWYTRKGYIFVGWNEKKNGTGVDWTGYINKNWKWTYTKNVTLYAQWKKASTLIPNANFNKCIIDSFNKQNGKKYSYKHIMSVYELSKITGVSCSTYIDNISGVEYMRNLTSLDLEEVSISSANLSKNTKLRTLKLGNTYTYNGSNLSSLNLSNNTALTTLILSNMSINNTLNLTKQTNLTNLKLYDVFATAKGITMSLDLTKNRKLQNLTIENNLNNINYSKIDFKNSANLVNLELGGISGIGEINLTIFKKLKSYAVKDSPTLKFSTSGKYTVKNSGEYKVYTK